MLDLIRGENGFGNIVYGAVGLVIFLILVGNIVMPTIMNVNQAATMTCGTYGNTTCDNAWSAADIAMWEILPIVVVASAIMFVIGKQ